MFSRKINSISLAAFLIGFFSFLSRLLGIVRDRILASQFGAGEVLDIYYAAFRIPDFIFNLLVLGAISAGFIPVFVSLREKQKSSGEIWKFVNNVFHILSLVLVLFCALGFVFAPFIIKKISPGFSLEAQALTVNLTRIMFFSPLFLGISSIIGGVLQSYKRFLVYSLSPIMYNLGIIFGCLYLVPTLGVTGLAWGVVIGAFLHMIIGVPILYKLGFRYEFILHFRSREIHEITRMMIPRVLSLSISQFNLFVITIIASTLSVGALSVFNLANNLQAFPVGIFGISFAIAAFPSLAELSRDKQKLISNVSLVVRKVLFLVTPFTVIFITLRAQIVRVILGSGKFDWTDTVLTMETLKFFALSLFAQSLIPVLTRVFYARKNSFIPFLFALISALTNIFLCFYFLDFFEVEALALAFSLSNIINFILLWVYLRFSLGGLDELKILVSAMKFSLAAISCGVIIQICKYLIEPFIDMNTFLGVASQGAFAGISGLTTYLLVCYILRSEELLIFLTQIKKRIRK